MESTASLLLHYLNTYGVNVVGALIILVAGKVAAGLGRKIVGRMLQRSKTDAAVVSFVTSLVHALILIFAILAALAKFGVQTTSFVAVLGAAGLAVGLALQGSLSNFAAGVLLLLFRPFKAGDYIEAAGVGGTVKEIQIFSTTLSTVDNVKITLPNNKVFGDTIKNYSAYDTRRVDLVVSIGYGASIDKAMEVLQELIQQEPRILSDPAPEVAVAELADSSVNLVVRPWVKGVDYWTVKFDFTRSIKEAFDRNGIEIPLPQRSVHLISK